MKKSLAKAAAAALLAGFLLLTALKGGKKQAEYIPYDAFWALAEKNALKSVTVGDGALWQAETEDGRLIETPNPRAQDGKERLLRLGVRVEEEKSGELPPALAITGIALLFFFLTKKSRGAAGLRAFAAVTPESGVPEVTFSDVAAAEDTLRSLRDLAAFLQEPDRYQRLGARCPKGVLLYGPPGNGKTLLARALAGEAKAPFFAVNGADFVQVYVGVGASRVRELFKKARKAGKGVIFIDEIDAIGKRRDNANDEREQTLNALLTEMSGFSQKDGIIVLAATNRADILDPALLREGRFDRRIEVGMPDSADRLKILRVHARNKPLEHGVSLEKIAQSTAMFSGAQLEALLNEAAIRAARRGAESIAQEDIDEAYCAVTVGEDRPRSMTEREKRIAAWHEAGHALITHHMQPEAQLTRLTVIPSSRGAAGYLMSVPPERLLHTKQELMAMICAALGGRAAEEMLLGKDNVTTGAASDLKKARDIAAAMVGDFGMGEDENAEKNQQAVLGSAFSMTRKCLAEHRDHLEALAGALMEKETLNEEEIKAILK